MGSYSQTHRLINRNAKPIFSNLNQKNNRFFIVYLKKNLHNRGAYAIHNKSGIVDNWFIPICSFNTINKEVALDRPHVRFNDLK